jgi:hypothetical protein
MSSVHAPTSAQKAESCNGRATRERPKVPSEAIDVAHLRMRMSCRATTNRRIHAKGQGMSDFTPDGKLVLVTPVTVVVVVVLVVVHVIVVRPHPHSSVWQF